MNPAADLNLQQRLIVALRDPRCYPDETRHVRLIETHISWILLAGRYAYKIKKSLNLGFLDFSTLPLRRHYCAEELSLNRRFAPGLYLDVVPIGGEADHPRFGAEPAIEYAVKMRRFAATRLMDRLLLRDEISPQHIDRLAATIAAFHAGLPASPCAFGSSSAIRAAALQNIEQLASLPATTVDGDLLARLKAATDAGLAECADAFESRRGAGFVRECHGDLHLGNIALIGDEPVLFDCIEFNPAFRWIDVMDELASPVMGLLRRERPDLAYRLLNAYLENTGDYDGLAVLPFYLTYRATVRAKVEAIRAGQPGLRKPARQELLEASRQYLVLACASLEKRRPALIITHGLPGSGKTHFAQMALERFGAIRVRSDVERKRLFGLSALERSHAPLAGGIYSSAATEQTYGRLLELSQRILASGFPVIVDAAFLTREQRTRFRELSQKMAVPFAIAVMPTDDSLLRTRIEQRQKNASDASEANIEVLTKMQKSIECISIEEQSIAIDFSTELSGWRVLEEMIRHG